MADDEEACFVVGGGNEETVVDDEKESWGSSGHFGCGRESAVRSLGAGDHPLMIHALDDGDFVSSLSPT